MGLGRNLGESRSITNWRLEVVKVDVDLVKVDALVMQKNTARIVGGLQKEDFLLYEDDIERRTLL
jgi:hypothetical protein